MAVNIKFDLSGNPELPTIILANKNGNKLGQLKVNADSVDLSDKLNDASEVSFTVNKYIDGNLTPLWDKIVDFKLIWCKEWDMWFEIKVELDEETETVKTVFCTQLGQAELSQIMLYNIEINTEADIERDDYKITILYDEDDPKASLLDRLLEKAPHYSIAHVDSTIKNIQRTFSFDGASICDAFQEVAEEIGCLFVYNSNSGDGGEIQRTISVYDLQQNCFDCGHRGEFTDKCPKCESTDIQYGYGNDTLIFVTSDELASKGIQFTTDTDSVKNCFKLEAGDDLMTATVRNCNPNGSDYIWRFSDMIKEDMSNELVEKIDSYDTQYKTYYNDYESKLNTTLVNKYNALVTKYSSSNDDLQSINTAIKGYSNLMNAYYNTIDLALYLKSSLMPSVEMEDTTATEQTALLTNNSLSPVAVNTEKVSSISLTTANSAVLSMAKIIVKSTYKVEINTSSISEVLKGKDENGKEIEYKTWTGNFVVTNYSDEEDTATSNTISVTINNDTETFIKQKIDKALNKENTDDYSISGLFEKKLIVTTSNNKKVYSGAFYDELKKYALNPLKTFYDACDSCLDILIDQGAGDKNKNLDLYEGLYEPYYNKSSAIAEEIKIREGEIAVIEGVWDNTDEDNPILKTKGLQYYIEECRNTIQNALDFENYLGEDLLCEFASYRREDTYSNSNYISDGLNNSELFEKALEFIEVAENEIYKSSELQCSISTNLNNLLAIDKFKPLVDSFKLGNWIRVQVNDEIYKLRLIEYEIDFGSFENIPVEFSNVTKIKNGITDIESVLSQASSMATSYDYTQRQAKQGGNAKGTVDQWLEKGLNSANVRIKSNNNEEVTLGKYGLLCRSYDDITDSYSSEQFRLTHNIMAYTTDNWETVSSALGKHSYKRWTGNEFVDDVGYGLSSTFVTAGYISGSQIIGGEVVSSNYESGKNGTYLNLLEGDFDFGGGKIIYDANEDKLKLKNVEIVWSSANAPSITDISELSDCLDDIGKDINDAEKNAKDYADNKDLNLSNRLTEAYKEYSDSKVSELDFAVGNYLGLGGSTLVGDNYVISPYIAGGYLNITNTNNSSRVIIDPNNLTGNNYIFQVHNGSKVTLGVKRNGDTDFAGKITSGEGEIGGWTIDTNRIYSGEGTSASKRFYLGSYNATNAYYIGVYAIVDGKYTYDFYVNKSGKLYATGAEITGDITATSLTLSGDTKIPYGKVDGAPTSVADLGFDTSTVIYKGDITQSTKTDSNGIQYLETSVPSANGTTITYQTYNAGDYMVFGRSKGTNSAGKNYICISKEGLLTARNALIYGTVYATDGEFTGKLTAGSGSTIGGWTMGTANNKNDNSVTQILSSVDGSCFLSPQGWTSTWTGNTTNEKYVCYFTPSFRVNKSGKLYASGAQIDGVLTAGSGSSIAGFTVGTAPKLGTTALYASRGGYEVGIGGGSTNTNLAFYVKNSSGDDIFYVRNNGHIKATAGTIGGWTISNDKLKNYHSATQGEFGAHTILLSDIGLEIYLGQDTSGSADYAATWAQIAVAGEDYSDERLKTNITSIDDNFEELYNALQPKSFNYIKSAKCGDINKMHFGFVAQDIVSAQNQFGLNDLSFVYEDEYYHLNIREFIALNTWQIQKAKARITELEEKVAKLEEKMNH